MPLQAGITPTMRDYIVIYTEMSNKNIYFIDNIII